MMINSRHDGERNIARGEVQYYDEMSAVKLDELDDRYYWHLLSPLAWLISLALSRITLLVFRQAWHIIYV